MAKKTQSDLALTALAVEAERRRKEKGLIRYNYGDLVAETTPEERQQIIEKYKKGRHRRPPEAAERFTETNDEEDLRALRARYGIPEEKPGIHPPRRNARQWSVAQQIKNKQAAGDGLTEIRAAEG